MHKFLRRLDLYWDSYPLFFITTCTTKRKAILDHSGINAILVNEWLCSEARHGWKIGRYVVMPDHVHFLCWAADENAKTISQFIQQWKQWTSKRICSVCRYPAPVWEKNFFDHVIRSAASSARIQQYILENPVRAGLVRRSEEWPWQGEINRL